MMQPDYSTNINQDKVNHSKDLTRGFEEALSLFCERRQKLNDLVIEMSAKTEIRNTKAEERGHRALQPQLLPRD